MPTPDRGTRRGHPAPQFLPAHRLGYETHPKVTCGICRIGTSGWSYPHWGRGVFYPAGVKPRDWLPYLAQHFDTVEVNSSFYRLPTPEMVRRWYTVTGRSFRFAFKLWRRITHERRLRDCDRELDDFVAVMLAFKGKRGPLLIQLPPGLRRDDVLLESCLIGLRKRTGRTRWRIAVEFRHTSWLCPPVRELLSRHRAALCLADLPHCPVTEPNEAPFVYVRRHVPGGAYLGKYSPRQIAADAAAITAWLAEGRDVYVYFNNDIGGYAVKNARQLQEAVIS